MTIIYIMSQKLITLLNICDGIQSTFSVQDNSIIWCIGWQKNQGSGITILGGSLSVNVSASSSGKNQYLNTGQLDVNGSSHIAFANLLWTSIAIVLVYILTLCSLRQ
ncbi:hypothetical protein B296_00006769 [Ensete ventricosum]|uniref:Uncharacterized protein n=1 Tax=Ensete ventricosum TaxID=4639 RepID=A0A427ASW9_ENSVE|nr:hypothetical protein B296_00006769 [Ensete ventricosum]